MKEILPDLYQISVPLPNNPLRQLNTYLIRGRDHSLLIDTGFRLPECRQALEDGIAAAGVDRDRLDVLLTHIHTDHTGLAQDMVGPGRSIYIGSGDYPLTRRLVEQTFWGLTDQRYAKAGFPPEEAEKVRAINPARTLGPTLDLPSCRLLVHGDRLEVGRYTLDVITTPGHTPGQVCLWLEKEQVMFTADHVLFDITPNITMWVNLKNALGHYLDSLQKVYRYPVKLALPGHRHSGDFHSRVEDLISHHCHRVDETLAIVMETPGLTAYEIAARMTWAIRARDWASFPLNQKWFAAGEAMAHLEFLLQQGRIRQSARKDALLRYFPLS